jgi:hypothetical protein
VADEAGEARAALAFDLLLLDLNGDGVASREVGVRLGPGLAEHVVDVVVREVVVEALRRSPEPSCGTW